MHDRKKSVDSCKFLCYLAEFEVKNVRLADLYPPLTKKIPSNPRYRNVEAVVDSGSSMTKYLKRIEEIRTNYKYKPNELFKRMKVTTFVQLIIQVSTVDGDVFFDDQSEVGDRPDTTCSELHRLDNGDSMDVTESNHNQQSDDGRNTTRSTLHGLITGVGEFDTKPSTENGGPTAQQTPSLTLTQPDPNLEERPFLVLDVRDQDEYNLCHVTTAENFPIALLSRSCNYESKSMLAYKNQPGKIIIMYDEDERMAPKAATTLVERGYDNLFLLSGGLKVAAKLYSNGLFTGTIPASILPSNKMAAIEPPSKSFFCREDVFALLDQTETSYDTKQTGSRLSRASNAYSQSRGPPSTARSSISVASSASQVVHRKPFR